MPSSFFDKLSVKLNGKGRDAAGLGAAKKDAPASKDVKAAPASAAGEDSQKLNVDVFQSPTEIVIYALAPGVDPADFEITLDEENDLLTIKGTMKRPQPPEGIKDEKDAEVKAVQKECSWVPFFRKIILPAEVDVVGARAIFKKGVLTIVLPILNISAGRKLKVVEELVMSADGAKKQ